MFLLFQAVLSGNTEVPARNLHQHIQNLMQTDPGDNVTPMELEFKNLANVKAEPARYFSFVACCYVFWCISQAKCFLSFPDRQIQKKFICEKSLKHVFLLYVYLSPFERFNSQKACHYLPIKYSLYSMSFGWIKRIF